MPTFSQVETDGGLIPAVSPEGKSGDDALSEKIGDVDAIELEASEPVEDLLDQDSEPRLCGE